MINTFNYKLIFFIIISIIVIQKPLLANDFQTLLKEPADMVKKNNIEIQEKIYTLQTQCSDRIKNEPGNQNAQINLETDCPIEFELNKLHKENDIYTNKIVTFSENTQELNELLGKLGINQVSFYRLAWNELIGIACIIVFTFGGAIFILHLSRQNFSNELANKVNSINSEEINSNFINILEKFEQEFKKELKSIDEHLMNFPIIDSLIAADKVNNKGFPVTINGHNLEKVYRVKVNQQEMDIESLNYKTIIFWLSDTVVVANDLNALKSQEIKVTVIADTGRAIETIK